MRGLAACAAPRITLIDIQQSGSVLPTWSEHLAIIEAALSMRELHHLAESA